MQNINICIANCHILRNRKICELVARKDGAFFGLPQTCKKGLYMENSEILYNLNLLIYFFVYFQTCKLYNPKQPKSTAFRKCYPPHFSVFSASFTNQLC